MENRKVRFQPHDFEPAQQDTKTAGSGLNEKNVAFFRDSFRRFSGNPSSVAGAVILAVLILLTILVPLLSPYDIENVRTAERFLAPKLFDAGGGFWDGTRKGTHVLYDPVNGIPALSDKNTAASIKQALVSLTVEEEPTLIDRASAYGTGGAVLISTEGAREDRNVYLASKPVVFTDKGGYTLDIVLKDEENLNGGEQGEYRVYLKAGEREEDILLLQDYSKVRSPLHFDISETLKKAGLSSLLAQVFIEVRSAAGIPRYVLIESAVLSGGSRAKNPDDLEAVSFRDATAMINVTDPDHQSYWACNGRKGIHASRVYYCDYVLDTYMLVYGDADPVTYSAADLYHWIENGWCEYDQRVGPESFVKLSDECPVSAVDSQTVLKVSGRLSSVSCRGWNYQRMGYKKMPRFLLGTDASGFDLLKRTFAGLRTSLLLGVCTAAFCFCFGIIWGAVSGYSGGKTDLIMERFCEILSGVPWIVVVTLCILHLGNHFFTYLLALCMTGWISTARRTRTQFYRFKGREYVLASRILGASDTRMIFRHILPNAMGTIITSSVLMIPGIIFSEAALAYLNLGLQGSQSFGVMMSANQSYLSLYPNLVIFPAGILALIMISFNLFGNGLRDAFNPALKGSE